MREENVSDPNEITPLPRNTAYSWEHVFWVLLAIACVPSVCALIEGGRVLGLAYGTTGPEAFVLDGARSVARGMPLYPPFGEPPYTIRVYNPLTYLPTGLLGRALHLDLHGMLWTGRFLSYLCSILLGVVLFWWLWRDTGDWKPGVLAGAGIFFFHEVMLTDFFRLRPESPALLFTFAGVAVFRSKTRHRVYAAAALFLIAFLFKQSFVAAPIAAALFLALSRDYGKALRFVATMSGLLAAFLGTMSWLTGTNYFCHALLAMAVDDVHPISQFLLYGPFLWANLRYLIFLVPIALGLLIVRRRFLYLVAYFGVSLIWSFYSAGKYGASYNYLAEWAILCLVVVAAALVRTSPRDRLVILSLLFALGFQAYLYILAEGLRGGAILVEIKELDPYVARYRALPGPKLIAHELLAVHLEEVEGLDWFLLEHLEQKKALDLSPLYRRIAAGEFSVCVFAQKPGAEMETRLRVLTGKGPYRFTFADHEVVEFLRNDLADKGTTTPVALLRSGRP